MNRDQPELDAKLDRFKTNADPEILAELFDHFRGRLRTMVTLRMDQRLRGRVDPSDVLQEAFLDLEERRENFAERGNMSFYVWLRLVVGERLLNIHRRHLTAEKRDARRDVSIHRRSVPDASSISLAAALLGRYSSVAQQAMRLETQTQLQEKIEQLDPNDREIIVLRTFEEMSNDEAAEFLGLSKYATSKRYIRAVKRLRTLLEEVPGFREFSAG